MPIPRRWSLAAPVILCAVAVTTLVACAVNPATGRREFSLVSEGQEIEMGREADGQIVASLGLYPDSSVQRYVRELGMELAAVSERPDLPWTFRVVDDPTVNAFALPGGFIYVTRGILANLTSEAQLVGVLGHEIGHVTARHSARQMSRQTLAQVALGVGMVLSEDIRNVGDYAMAGLQLLSLSFSRGDESQADELGVRYMRQTGHDPRELASVMRMLERTSQLAGGSGRIPEWLSTHPDPANRVEHIQELVTASGEDYSGAIVRRVSYLRHLDGMMFGANPREGYFEGEVFHHPDLRFRVTFPDGWSGVNTKSAVQGVAPSEDAVILLALAEGTPSAALDGFASQNGVTVGRRSTGNVNGLEAASAPFTATTEDGTLSGSVLFVRHDGTTYRLLGLAPSNLWEGYRGAVAASLGSFRTETDPEVLNVRADRIDLVELGSATSFDAFLTRYPSVVDAQVVAVINQVETSGTLSSGTLAKRIVGGG